MSYMGSRYKVAPGGSGDSFSPFSLFPLGTEKGMWLDPSSGSTGYQDSIGTAGVVNSPIGLRLDKRLSAALGSEVVSVAADREFSADTGWWTKSASVAIGGGTANFSASGINDAISRAGIASAGKVYEMTFTVTAVTVGGVQAIAGSTRGTARTTTGTYTERIVAAGAGSDIGFVASVGPTTASIDNVSIKEVTGNHVSQSTAAARPTWKLNGSIYSDLFDGVDDGYSTAAFAAGTLSADMDLFFAVKRAAAGDGLAVFESAGANFIGAWSSGLGLSTASGVGAGFSVFVDGLAVADARNALHTALGSGSWKILEYRNLNLSAWTALKVGNYGLGYNLNGDFGGAILCPAQSNTVRSQIRRWLGAKAGLSL